MGTPLDALKEIKQATKVDINYLCIEELEALITKVNGIATKAIILAPT